MTAAPDFLQRADAVMAGIQAAVDAFDPDEIEADLSGGVLKIRFGDGKVCVMNRQTAAQQIWLAEGASAWHFAWDPTASGWTDTKGRGELRQVLSGILSRRLQRVVAL